MPLRRCIVELQRVLSGDIAFEPATSRRRFTVSMGDIGVGVLPGLLARLSELAPSVSVDVRPLTISRYEDRLASGELDLAIRPHYRHFAAGLVTRPLYTESFVCMARAAAAG